MPIYAYRKPDGEVVDLPMSNDDREAREFHDADLGQCITLDDGTIAVRVFSSLQRSGKRGWPLVSDGLGVHTSQIAGATRHARAAGCDVSFNEIGQCVVPNREQRNRYMKLRGNFDRDAGYGDRGPP